GEAVAPVFRARRDVGEASAVAALRQHLTLLPIADHIAISGIDDGRPLARQDGIGPGLGRDVAISADRCLPLGLDQPRQAPGARRGPACLDRSLDRTRTLRLWEQEIRSHRASREGADEEEGTAHRLIDGAVMSPPLA